MIFDISNFCLTSAMKFVFRRKNGRKQNKLTQRKSFVEIMTITCPFQHHYIREQEQEHLSLWYSNQMSLWYSVTVNCKSKFTVLSSILENCVLIILQSKNSVRWPFLFVVTVLVCVNMFLFYFFFYCLIAIYRVRSVTWLLMKHNAKIDQSKVREEKWSNWFEDCFWFNQISLI